MIAIELVGTVAANGVAHVSGAFLAVMKLLLSKNGAPRLVALFQVEIFNRL